MLFASAHSTHLPMRGVINIAVCLPWSSALVKQQARYSCCAQVGDHVVVDGGMVTLDVLEKAGPDVRCKVADPGIILSRANLTFRRDGHIVRARNSMLPVLSSKVCTF